MNTHAHAWNTSHTGRDGLVQVGELKDELLRPLVVDEWTRRAALGTGTGTRMARRSRSAVLEMTSRDAFEHAQRSGFTDFENQDEQQHHGDGDDDGDNDGYTPFGDLGPGSDIEAADGSGSGADPTIKVGMVQEWLVLSAMCYQLVSAIE